MPEISISLHKRLIAQRHSIRQATDLTAAREFRVRLRLSHVNDFAVLALLSVSPVYLSEDYGQIRAEFTGEFC